MQVAVNSDRFVRQLDPVWTLFELGPKSRLSSDDDLANQAGHEKPPTNKAELAERFAKLSTEIEAVAEEERQKPERQRDLHRLARLYEERQKLLSMTSRPKTGAADE